jgi:hypothetical protein
MPVAERKLIKDPTQAKVPAVVYGSLAIPVAILGAMALFWVQSQYNVTSLPLVSTAADAAVARHAAWLTAVFVGILGSMYPACLLLLVVRCSRSLFPRVSSPQSQAFRSAVTVGNSRYSNPFTSTLRHKMSLWRTKWNRSGSISTRAGTSMPSHRLASSRRWANRWLASFDEPKARKRGD